MNLSWYNTDQTLGENHNLADFSYFGEKQPLQGIVSFFTVGKLGLDEVVHFFVSYIISALYE